MENWITTLELMIASHRISIRALNRTLKKAKWYEYILKWECKRQIRTVTNLITELRIAKLMSKKQKREQEKQKQGF